MREFVIKTILIVALILCATIASSQNVVRKGNVFVQQDKTVGDSINTGYYYQDRDGNKHPIFLSPKGKAYCWVQSKKTGKWYRRYLPKVTEQLNKEKNGNNN